MIRMVNEKMPRCGGMSRGVVVMTAKEGIARKKYVHVSGGGEDNNTKWEITSDVPLTTDMLHAPLLDNPLPGLFGCYILPKDALFQLCNSRNTRVSDFNDAYERELTRTRNDERDDMLNHLTVHSLDKEKAVEDVEEDEVDEVDEVEKDSGDEEDEQPGLNIDELWIDSDDDE